MNKHVITIKTCITTTRNVLFSKISPALLLFFLLLISGCGKEEDPVDPVVAPATTYDASVPTAWFKVANELNKATPGYTPPVVARTMGYAGLALYEAVVPGMPEYQSLSGQLNGFALDVKPVTGQQYYWPACANSALATVFRTLYDNAPQNKLAEINALELKFTAEFATKASPVVLQNSADFGKAIAEAILQYAKKDGGDACNYNNFPENYVAPVGPGMWAPTAPGYSRALQPYWGLVRPFIGKDVEGNIPPPPAAYSSEQNSACYKEAEQVYETSLNLTPEQKIIANFWSDDAGKTATPPGHSISILTQVLLKNNSDLATAAEAYAKLGMALDDAFIACWYTKFRYNVLRPITYIQQNIDPNWQPILNTPPFPEYTSGHSVQSAATAEILTSLFGDNYSFADNTHEARTDIDGTPRTFHSFWEAANEAAISRLYGGIHYQAAIDKGIDQGKIIGQNINKLRFRKF